MNGMSTVEKTKFCEVFPSNIGSIIWDPGRSTGTSSKGSSQKKFQTTEKTASVGSRQRFGGEDGCDGGGPCMLPCGHIFGYNCVLR
jgi:hypothetical protein